jgi:metal-responsive CopG/Arc/MetJ family transcriptional regulator
MARTTLSLPDELDERIEMDLSYGDSKSEWLRHAIKMRMQVDPILDEIHESYQREERIELVEAAVRKEVDRRKNGPHDYDDQSNDPL